MKSKATLKIGLIKNPLPFWIYSFFTNVFVSIITNYKETLCLPLGDATGQVPCAPSSALFQAKNHFRPIIQQDCPPSSHTPPPSVCSALHLALYYCFCLSLSQAFHSHQEPNLTPTIALGQNGGSLLSQHFPIP